MAKLFSKLRGAITENDIKYQDIAEEMGISRAYLCNKFSGKSEFLVKDVYFFMKKLDISKSDFEVYFPESDILHSQKISMTSIHR